ncbi:endonuclease/exonuclease/phosphatase family protein [Lutibacter sp.]|uniref:endonuclease/exonuclease/phosphatase family protein n=1 Tax=Lutibacter sp. TaxID=1925666 RepID=UPI0025B7AA89|nr:endonuclease/exonuclease/phosphatase family protein [Lutibacter sp.]
MNLSVTIAQSTKIISYNIRYANNTDKENNWNNRKDKIISLLKNNNPAILGIQEGLIQQIDYIDSCLSNYKYIGIGRDGKNKGEFSAIFYDSLKYNVIESNTFWLSNTPNKISKGWDAALNRICTYGLFENLKSHKKVWIFNTHFDHIGKIARKNSVQLILTKINEINTTNFPLILMGDLNLTPEEAPIQLLKSSLDDGLELSNTPLIGPKGTFNGFSLDEISKKIDYFFTKNLTILSYTHINDLEISKSHISDHLPIMIEIKF